jgi:hypothetical protein
MNFKLTKKQLKMIEKNLEKFCDQINCDNFSMSMYKIYDIYLLDVEFTDNIKKNKYDKVIELVEFYLKAFVNGDDEKVY